MGPVLTIELAEAVPLPRVRRLRGSLERYSSHFEETRVGEYDLNVRARGLGVTDAEADDAPPVMVSLRGPGFGDDELVRAEQSGEAGPKPPIGFTPTHAVDVIAFCNGRVDHLTTALLAAAVIDVTGGVVNAELREDQLPVVAGLPGLLATAARPWPAAYGSAAFLRAWAQQPTFRLMK